MSSVNDPSLITFQCWTRTIPHLLILLTALPILYVEGCAAPVKPDNPAAVANPGAAYVTLGVDSGSESEVVPWLRFAGVRIDKDPNGDDRVFNSPECRSILVKYRRMLHLRMDLTAENIANLSTIRDAQGKNHPYRRKFVVADANGTVKVETDRAPFLKRYLPGDADADANGYVQYPNVDQNIETVNALATSRSYQMATTILLRFDPTFVNEYQADRMEDQPIAFSSSIISQPNKMVNIVDQLLSQDELGRIDSYLNQKQVPHRVDAGTIVVPADRKEEVLADLVYAHQFTPDGNPGLVDTGKQPDSLVSRRGNFRQSAQEKLTEIIQNFPGVRNAKVIINTRNEQRIESSIPPTVIVAITTDGTINQPKSFATSAADSVAQVVAGLTLENVSVIIDGISYPQPEHSHP